MCRLLCLLNSNGVDPNPHLERFAYLSQNSREYQGHGWGCAWLNQDNSFEFHHNLKPVWEDKLSNFPRTRLLVAHARSAFRDEGVAIENNMPFCDNDNPQNVFAFNGELQGVRIKEQGRIGAEKIFNYVRRFNKGSLDQAITRATDIIHKKTRYVRAMNFMIANTSGVHVYSSFGEDSEYFQLRQTRQNDTRIVCSQTYGDAEQWEDISNNSQFFVPLN